MLICMSLKYTQSWFISSCRGQFNGLEPLRLAVLKYAAVLGAPYVDVEYLAANFFFASACVPMGGHSNRLFHAS